MTRSETSAGTVVYPMKVMKERSKRSPISMFWGLPMIVAMEPAFALKARANRNGTGFSRRTAHTCNKTGANATAITSLVKKADMTPTTPITNARKASGPMLSERTRSAREE